MVFTQQSVPGCSSSRGKWGGARGSSATSDAAVPKQKCSSDLQRKFTFKFTYKMAPAKTVCSHFCPSATQKWLACEHSERRIPGLRDANWQAPWFPASSRQSVTHLRNAEGGCVGGLKRKVLVLNGPNRPKRPENGPYQAHRGRCGDRYGLSEALPYHTSHPRAHLQPLLKTLFYPFVRSGA